MSAIELSNRSGSGRPDSNPKGLKIIFNGRGDFGRNVLEALVADGHNILTVVAPIDPADPLRNAAEELNIKVVNLGRVNSRQVQKEMRKLRADIGVMAFVQKKIDRETYEIPKHGTYNFHPSDLPKRRGRDSQNWAIIQGDEYMADTFYKIDEGLDTGPILLKKVFPIPENATQNSLYKNTVAPVGVEVVREGVQILSDAILEGRRSKKKIRIPLTPQDESQATEDPPIEKDDVRLDFNHMTATEAHNMIRGAQNSPGAFVREGVDTYINMFDSEALSGPVRWWDIGTYTVLEEGIAVHTKQGLIKINTIRRVQGNEKGKFQKASEYALEHKIPTISLRVKT